MKIKFENPFTDNAQEFDDMVKIEAYLTNGTIRTYILGEELVIDNPSVKKFIVYTESRKPIELTGNWMPVAD